MPEREYTVSEKLKKFVKGYKESVAISDFLKEIENILVPDAPYCMVLSSEEAWMEFQNLIENNYSWLMSQHLPILQIILGVMQHYENEYMSYDLFHQVNHDIQTKCKYFLEG